ncbi:MAG TPA: MarR family winged helix-turn-helix transcriptional regulator [Chitinophaga sp.]|uniref:MarR family winged helix-turn-helix transcriptional regulator n=1 Tax=Chitinophaga sp. TaxID=1869181 RepID=UPI002C779E58|nr:MarR family winged helix-turn-helix transcriptional regulator [Chitinophaga sp.]HVI47110.1 MarR family winged helix-turn-helix transcriptional regulator [Chitinophaga sp.]
MKAENQELASRLRAVVSKMHNQLRKHIYTEKALSLTETATLSHLYKEGPSFPSVLADIVKVKNQSMSQILNNLQELGYITRKAVKEDKRKVTIAITPQGKKLVDKTRSQRDELLANAIQQHLSDTEVKTLEKSIALIELLANQM